VGEVGGGVEAAMVRWVMRKWVMRKWVNVKAQRGMPTICCLGHRTDLHAFRERT
jgi:hypothetical protein